MSVPEDLLAVRTTAAYRRSPELTLLGLRGDDALPALERLLPSRLFLRDAQVKESLLLDEAGRPLADALVCADDEDFLLIVEGMSPDALLAHVEEHLPHRVNPTLVDQRETHEVISLHGPWAWHLVAQTLGDDMVALPYLNFFRVDAGLCVRAGKTGEYGYDLVVQKTAADGVWSAVREAADAMGALEVGPDALSLCRFENWFFDPAHVPDAVTPLELQLSWRLELEREGWLGREALIARATGGVQRRLLCLLADAEVDAGAPVTYDGASIGVVTRAAFSPVLERWVLAALIDVAWAHGAIERYRAGDVAVTTTAPPLIDNRSLYVDPRRHAWSAREEVVERPLVRGRT